MKLTLVSITIKGRRYSAFIQASVASAMTEKTLEGIFPALKQLGRGKTYTIG